MHILDLIMYFVTCGLIWGFMDYAFDHEYTEEIGGLVGLMVLCVWTVIFITLFFFIDYNWIDIFNFLVYYNYKSLFKL